MGKPKANATSVSPVSPAPSRAGRQGSFDARTAESDAKAAAGDAGSESVSKVQSKLNEQPASVKTTAKSGAGSGVKASVKPELRAIEPKTAMPLVAPPRSNRTAQTMPPLAPTLSGSSASGQAQSVKDLLRQGSRLHARARGRKGSSAELAYRKALSIDPHNADAFYNLVFLAEARNDFVTAITYYRAALSFNASDKEISAAIAG